MGEEMKNEMNEEGGAKSRMRAPVLSLYALFHCNLAFSSIEKSDYPSLIKRCYRPILSLAEAGFPVALEMTAWTLREVQDLDPEFTERLRALLDEGAIDFIGSGHAQCIMPLIPAEVNRWNLELGTREYEEILGRRPTVALVNEQTFSAGLTGLYREAGYRAIIMDWSNSSRHNGYERTLLYRPQRAAGIRPGEETGVLWSHSIAFQKFGRAARGELDMGEYMDYLRGHRSAEEDRVFPAYSNDAEVFDFTPGRGEEARGDFERIRRILELIRAEKGMTLMRPADILEKFAYGREGALVRLESVETPIVCKKQEKYNPLRWAVTGRDSAHVNARCRVLHERVAALGRAGLAGTDEWDEMRRGVVELWGSDFRTNTTDGKMALFSERMGWLLHETERRMEEAGLSAGKKRDTFPRGGWKDSEKGSDEAAAEEIDKDKDAAGAQAPALSGANLLCLAGPYVASTAALCSGFMDGAEIREDERRVVIKTGSVEAEFLKDRGLALSFARFPLVSDEALVGTIRHGHYDSIELGADFYSGHLIHTGRDGRKTTDLCAVRPLIAEDETGVTVSAMLETAIGAVEKTWRIRRGRAEFTLTYRLRTPGLTASILRLGIFTLLPRAFERESLYYETVNGGAGPERFYLRGRRVSHERPVNQANSASMCLGATEGWVSMGDSEKKITICSEGGSVQTVPMVDYRETDRTFFLRLYQSAGEIDDTAYWVWRGMNEMTFRVRADRADED